jgi:tetratricopeptide (TPR) repeat protein
MRFSVVLLCGWFLVPVLLAADNHDLLTELGEIRDVTIVVGDQPYIGDLLPPPTEGGFRFRWAETDDVLTFRWSTLDETQRRYIQKLFGIEVAAEGTHLLWGEMVDCVRLFLSRNKSLEGYESTERAMPGFRCLKTATQVMQIPANMVEREEKIQKRESDVYSPEEGLEFRIQRRPPAADSPNDYLQLARDCAQMGLYGHAIDYLSIAEALDPRVPELARDFRGELLAKNAEVQARKLYETIVRDIFRTEYSSALERCQSFIRNFPNSELRTKVESMLPDVTEKRRVNLVKQVVFMYYTLVHELIADRMMKKTKIDGLNRPVAAIPGKMVTTKEGLMIRGRLASETGEAVIIQRDDLAIEVPRKSILAIQDVDLSYGVKRVPPFFTELKNYVTDTQGGLGGDLVHRISRTLDIPPGEVRKIWADRFHQTAVVRDGQLQKSPVYYSKHIINYGKGSWLREGTAQGRGHNAPQHVHPEYSDDPDIWWTAQYPETKAAILKAMAVEKIFKVKGYKHRACPECGGRGVVSGNGGAAMARCPNCRGLKVLTAVIYE